VIRAFGAHCQSATSGRDQIQIALNSNRKTRPPCGGRIDGLGVRQGPARGTGDALVTYAAWVD
jgi:hypothetical protein